MNINLPWVPKTPNEHEKTDTGNLYVGKILIP